MADFFSDLIDFFTGTSSDEKSTKGTSESLKTSERTEDRSEQEATSVLSGTVGEQTQAASGRTAGTTTADEVSTTSLFGTDDRTSLDTLIERSLAGTDPGAGIGGDIAAFIFGQAKAAPGLASAGGTAAENLARLEFQRTAIPALTQAASRIGSSENTLVDQLTGRASEELGIRLADIRAQTNLQGQELATRGGALAADAASRASAGTRNDFASVIDALGLARGSEAITTSVSAGTQDQTQEKLATVDTFQESVTNTSRINLISKIQELVSAEKIAQTGVVDVSSGSDITDFLDFLFPTDG